MVAIRSPDDDGEVVAEIFAGEEARAVGENDVILGEALEGGGRGRDEEDWTRSEAEKENGAVFVGNFG